MTGAQKKVMLLQQDHHEVSWFIHCDDDMTVHPQEDGSVFTLLK